MGVGAEWQAWGVSMTGGALSAPYPKGNGGSDYPPAIGKMVWDHQFRQGGLGFRARREEEGRR